MQNINVYIRNANFTLMEFIDEKIENYALSHSQPESDVLHRLNRETHSKVLVPRMLSGHMQGNVLSMFSKMIQPKQILEIGTYTGYSGICLAQGLQEGGKLHTIDINVELEKMVRAFIAEAGLTEKINYYLGDAIEVIPTINELFDLVFIDADKKMKHAMVVKFPNITNIVYGRDVGYKVEQVKLSDEIESISATDKRKEMGI